jgi:hypothetical protein
MHEQLPARTNRGLFIRKYWPFLVSTTIFLLSILVCGLILMINQAGRNGSFAMQELSENIQKQWVDLAILGAGVCLFPPIFLIVLGGLVLATNNLKNGLIVIILLLASAGIFIATLFFSFSSTGFLPVDDLTVNQDTFHLVRISVMNEAYFRLYKCDSSGIFCETLFLSKPDSKWYKPANIYYVDNTISVKLDGEVVYTQPVE